MKRVRVMVVFEEVDDVYEVVQGRPNSFKFGSVTNEHFGPPEIIAAKVAGLVHDTINEHFPAFLGGADEPSS